MCKPTYVILIYFLCQARGAIQRKSILIEELLNTTVYNPTERPLNYNDPDSALLVDIDLVIVSVGPVKSVDMLLDLSFYLRMEWQDQRLFYDPRTLQPTNNISFEHYSERELSSTIEINHKLLHRLWTPNLYFPKSKESHAHKDITPNMLINISPNGTILYSQRISTSTRCYMDLLLYPHDRQNCSFSLASYSLTVRNLKLRWSPKRKATTLHPDVFLQEFLLIKIIQGEDSQEYEIGKYAQLDAILFLHRQIGYYVTQVYLPTTLIVMISWVAFWIELNATAGRVSISLLTLTTITTQSASARVQLPRVPYVKAIDVFMAVNIFYVFAACMEYAIAHVFSRRYRRKHSLIPSVDPDSSEDIGQGGHTYSGTLRVRPRWSSERGNNLDNPLRYNFKSRFLQYSPEYMTTYRTVCRKCWTRFGCCLKKPRPRDTGYLVDWYSRIFFPLTYFVFLFIYWTVLPWSATDHLNGIGHIL